MNLSTINSKKYILQHRGDFSDSDLKYYLYRKNIHRIFLILHNRSKIIYLQADNYLHIKQE